MTEIIDVIKYEGDNSTFVWKHPIEDFNSSTQLIVHESQEAIFFMNGQALDLFGPGRHTLETQNIPLIKKFFNKTSGDKTPFHCELYFINKTDQMAIKWGTDSKVQYLEPTYNFPISIGASGEMALSAEDSRKLLVKLVGTEKVLNRNTLVSFFRSFLVLRVKTYIAQIMKSDAINIFEIDEKLESFSTNIKERLDDDFLDYGISLQKFLVTTIVKPDGERQYERFKDIRSRQSMDILEAELQQKVSIIDQHTEAQRIVIDSQAIAQKRVQEGYTYQQERGFDVAEKTAANEGVGEFANMGIGLGMMSGVGGAVGGAIGGMAGGAVEDAFSSTNNQSTQGTEKTKFCEECGTEVDLGAAFCDSCGKAQLDANSCKKCDYEFERPGKFCPKCGESRGEKGE